MITSYPRVTIQGTGNTNNPQNGFGMMVWNTSTLRYELLTAQTFLSIANQANQVNQINAFNNSTNNGILTDTCGNTNLTSTFTALPNVACKYVTLYCDIAVDVRLGGSSNTMKTIAGVPTRINRTNANLIEVSEGGGAGLLSYIITT